MREGEVAGEQLELALNWGREPWGGRSPRSLTRGYCVVDNSDVRCEAARLDEKIVRAAQFTMFLQGTPHGS